MKPDFLEETIRSRSKKSPTFCQQVEQATSRRASRREALSTPVQIRFTPSQKALVKRAAKKLKVKYTTALRNLAIEWAEKNA